MCLESCSQYPLQRMEFQRTLQQPNSANTNMKWAGGLTESEWEVTSHYWENYMKPTEWNLMGKIKIYHSSSEKSPAQTQNGNNGFSSSLALQAWWCTSRVKSTTVLQKSGNARSRAYKTQPTSTTQFYMVGPWLSGYFWQNFSASKNWRKLTEE